MGVVNIFVPMASRISGNQDSPPSCGHCPDGLGSNAEKDVSIYSEILVYPSAVLFAAISCCLIHASPNSIMPNVQNAFQCNAKQCLSRFMPCTNSIPYHEIHQITRR